MYILLLLYSFIIVIHCTEAPNDYGDDIESFNLDAEICNDWDRDTTPSEDSHDWDTGAHSYWDGDTMISEGHHDSSNSGDQHDKDTAGNWDAPLYSDAGISVTECICLIMGFVLSARLTQESIQLLLDLLIILLPFNQLLHRKSNFLFKKFFNKVV